MKKFIFCLFNLKKLRGGFSMDPEQRLPLDLSRPCTGTAVNVIFIDWWQFGHLKFLSSWSVLFVVLCLSAVFDL